MTLNRAQLSIVTLGCSAGIVLALIGAAYAVDTPPPALLKKGDRVAVEVATKATSLTIEEVNLDIGVSNLISIEPEPAPQL